MTLPPARPTGRVHRRCAERRWLGGSSAGWRYAAFVGAVASLFVMAVYFGPTELIPILGDLAVIWLAVSPPALAHAG